MRAFRAVGGEAPFIESAHGAYLIDSSGREYIDYIGSWGPMILGHANARVVSAVQEAATKGLSFGASTEAEVLFAERIAELYPSIEMLRCVSSGTEATMSALRVARGSTGRPLIVKFDGNYHGHSDGLLVQAGSGAATFGSPDSAGVPEDIAKNTISARFNDLRSLEDLFARLGPQIAAVIVEPVAGNMGCVPPVEGFLSGLLSLCSRYQAVSIFDEVMTGSRLSPSGAQGRFSLRPDLTCLGKVVGGGMPLAVYGGKREIMEHIAPLGPVYQAGTLSGNPISIAAALASLAQLDDELYARLESTSQALYEGLLRLCEHSRLPTCVQRVGSMMTLFFHPGPVTCWDDAKLCDTKAFGRMHQALLRRGIYWPPAQFEAAFVSGSHGETEISTTLEAFSQALREAEAGP